MNHAAIISHKINMPHAAYTMSTFLTCIFTMTTYAFLKMVVYLACGQIRS